MKKFIIIALVAVIGVFALLYFKDHFGVRLFSSKGAQGGDLVIVNDSSDIISVEYKENGTNVSPTVPVGANVTGGRGFIRVSIAKKAGTYELTYPFPRPVTGPQQVTLSQIIESVKQESPSDELIVKKGMIGDIKVDYEEVRDLDATY